VPELIVGGMAQCDSKVFFPDDPTQALQFSDCPPQAETTRRTIHSVVKLCPEGSKVWYEQEERQGSLAAAASCEGFFKFVIGKRVLFAVPVRGANLLMIVLRRGATWLHLLEHLEPF